MHLTDTILGFRERYKMEEKSVRSLFKLKMVLLLSYKKMILNKELGEPGKVPIGLCVFITLYIPMIFCLIYDTFEIHPMVLMLLYERWKESLILLLVVCCHFTSSLKFFSFQACLQVNKSFFFAFSLCTRIFPCP